MHDLDSQTELTPSTEAVEETASGTNMTRDDGLEICPQLIREVAQEIRSHTPAQPKAVVATLFAIVAAAFGPNAFLDGNAAILNVLVAHDAPRNLPWFDAVMAPLID